MPELPIEPVMPEHDADHDPIWQVTVGEDGVGTYACANCPSEED